MKEGEVRLEQQSKGFEKIVQEQRNFYENEMKRKDEFLQQRLEDRE
jgi:hypothetical protein